MSVNLELTRFAGLSKIKKRGQWSSKFLIDFFGWECRPLGKLLRKFVPRQILLPIIPKLTIVSLGEIILPAAPFVMAAGSLVLFETAGETELF